MKAFTSKHFSQAARLNTANSNATSILTRLQALTNPSITSQNLSSGDIIAANTILLKVMNSSKKQSIPADDAYVSQRQDTYLFPSVSYLKLCHLNLCNSYYLKCDGTTYDY